MLLYLFPEKFSREVVAATYQYYEPITDHRSSLSPSIHAAITARLGLRDQAEQYWRQSLWLTSQTLWEIVPWEFILPVWEEPGRHWFSVYGSERSIQSLGCATWLASQLKAQLHILSASTQVLPAKDALIRLKVPEEFWPLITLHQAPQYPEAEILAAIGRYSIEALMVAIRLANALDLKVRIVHVADSETSSITMKHCDEAHHEYPHKFNEFITQACPFCSPEERRCIEGFSLLQGDVTTEILKLVEQEQISLLVVEWHGQFMMGHAQVLKNLIRVITHPVLLVKPGVKAPFKLKVGEEMEA